MKPAVAERFCPACRAHDPIQPDEPVWPIGWHCPACDRSIPQREGVPLLAPDLAEARSGFDAAAFAALAEIETTHFWFAPRNELIVGLANRFFPNATRYLEIGCGNGEVMRTMAQTRRWKRLVGSDLHATALKHTRMRVPQEVELVQMDARAIPAQNTFDLIGAYDVVEHVAEDEELLRALRGATEAGGGVIIAVPQHPALWSRRDEMAYHQRRYRRGELEAKLKRNGFDILFSSSYTTVLLPLMALSRIKARVSSKDANVDREMSLGATLNAILKSLLRAEVRLTLAGLRWPVGGSRVVVARAV
jgi:SAM-dependent methyltransferase